MATTLPREQELVQALIHRDKSALAELYDRYGGALFGVISQIVRDNSVAEEILQEAFIRIWNKIPQYDVLRGTLFTWMVNIARNLSIDYLRSRQGKFAAMQDQLGDHAHHLARIGEELYVEGIGIRELVAGLKAEQQEVVELLYFSGYTQSEAAKALNLPLGTVKTRIRAALKQLRKLT